ncbi:MAG: O-antigen ligase family protein [Isosphaeraceae bacterium]|jgi:O-antigen ligase/Flp pilus assembly protein TadD
MRSRLTFSEIIVLGMACLAPWAFGSVDAWAEFALALGIALLGTLAMFTRPGSNAMRRLTCLPSLALGGLAVLAVAQATPLPAGFLRRLDPVTAALHGDLLPAQPEVVHGDPAAPVTFPPQTISLEPGVTVQAAVKLAAAWVLFQAVLGLTSGFAGLRRLGLVLAGNATLVALVGLVQALTWNGCLLWIRPLPNGSAWSSGGPFACHSHFAEYLNLGLGFALGSLLARSQDGLLRGSGGRLPQSPRGRLLDRLLGGRGGRLWAAYAAGVLVVGILTSQSRGGFLAMTAATVTLLVGLLMRSGRLAASLRLAATLGVILAMSALLLLVLGNALPYQERLASILEPEGEGYTGRFSIWAGALRAWRNHPFWGTGLGTFAAATAPFFDRDHGVVFARGENEYVDLLTEGGLLGLGLGLAFLFGIGRRAIQALVAAPSARDRGAVLGGIFGLLALAFHSLSDFGPHVPGVGIPALILAGYLVRLGLVAHEPGSSAEPKPTNRGRRVLTALVATGPVVLGLVVAIRSFAPFQVERLVSRSGLPLPGTFQPSPRIPDLSATDLDLMRTALEAALQIQPDWAEGHLRLAQTYLGLYQAMTEELISPELNDPKRTAIMANPLWLLSHLTSKKGGQPAVPIQEMLEQEPIRRCLVPAARCFLQARRCRVVSAHAQVGLASLNYLLEHGDSSAEYLKRGLRLAGADSELLNFAALVAVQVDEFELAARFWRRSLEVKDENWAEVADLSSSVLPPERIRDDVVPSGRSALRFAERLYSAPADHATRDSFLQAAVEHLPEDRGLTDAERLSLEAQAYALLNHRDQACERMHAALVLEPSRVEWRNMLIDWLLAWGRSQEAHDDAMVGVYYRPNDPTAQRALERTDEALARGDAPAGAAPRSR